MKAAIFIFLLFSFNFTYSYSVLDTCSYKDDLDRCIKENNGWSPRTIEDFICIDSSNSYEILPQIILSREFSKIDNEVESYMQKFEDNKSEFFWQNATKSLIEAIDEIEDKFSTSKDNSFWKKYMEICSADGVILKATECFWSVPNISITDYFNTETCKTLVWTKLEIYKAVLYNILKLNKHQVRNDENKKNTQKRRSSYSKLLDIININIWYMERIWKKWPSKTKDAKPN